MRPDTAVPPLSGLGLEGGTAFQSGSCKINSLFAFHLSESVLENHFKFALRKPSSSWKAIKGRSKFRPQLGTVKRDKHNNVCGPILDLFLLTSVLRGLQEQPRAVPTLFFRFQEPPRALQEGSKTLSEGIRVEDTIRIPFWTHFWLGKESLRP